MKLFLKGERCHTEKCAIEKRNFPPGQHGKDRKPKIVGYGLQLREKQKARRYYQCARRPVPQPFEKAAEMKGITGENMLGMLERRLDNVIYPDGFRHHRAPRRARLVRHGHIQVNGRKVNIPSFTVKANDVIEVREKQQEQPHHSGRARRHGPCPQPQLAGSGPRRPEGARARHAQARGTGPDPVERAAHRRVVFEVVVEATKR